MKVPIKFPYTLLRIKVRLPVLLCAVKTVEGDFRFCWTISPNIGQTHKENPNLEFFIWYLHRMIYTNSTTNYTNIGTQKSVHFAVSRTETCLKMRQTCIWNTGHMQSIAGPVHASAVWTDEKKKKKKKKNTNFSYRIFIVCRSPVSPVFWARILNTGLTLPKQSLCTIFAITR